MTGEKRGISASAQRAREILSKNGNRITLIGALLVWMASFLIYRFLFTGIGLLATLFYLDTGLWNFLLTGGYLVLSLLYTQLVVIPLFYGVMLVAHGMSRGERVPLAEIFLPFAQKKSYRRAVRLADGFLWRALVAVILGDVVCGAVKASLRSAFLSFVICFLIVVGEIFLCMVIGRRYFRTLLVALEYPDAPGRVVRQKTKMMHTLRPWSPFLYWLYFIPRILLGIATLGIYLVAEALPVMTVTYFCECNKTLDLIKRLEEHKDHE